MSTPGLCPSNVKLPASEFISIPPTEVLIFVAPSTSIDKVVEYHLLVIAPLQYLSISSIVTLPLYQLVYQYVHLMLNTSF